MTTRPTIATPTIHRNGSARETLLDGYTEAARAVRKAIDATAASAPNGRDYYPQGDAAIQKAQREHEDRMRRLHGVLSELIALQRAVANG